MKRQKPSTTVKPRASVKSDPVSETVSRETIHDAVSPAVPDTSVPSWGFGLGTGGADVGFQATLGHAALIREIAALGHHGEKDGPAGAMKGPPKPPDDEFDIDQYPHAPGSIKDPK